jgi:hypothetical protein
LVGGGIAPLNLNFVGRLLRSDLVLSETIVDPAFCLAIQLLESGSEGALYLATWPLQVNVCINTRLMELRHNSEHNQLGHGPGLRLPALHFASNQQASGLAEFQTCLAVDLVQGFSEVRDPLPPSGCI